MVTTDRYLVIVDTYATPELALELVETIQADLPGRQLLVINTHADWAVQVLILEAYFQEPLIG